MSEVLSRIPRNTRRITAATPFSPHHDRRAHRPHTRCALRSRAWVAEPGVPDPRATPIAARPEDNVDDTAVPSDGLRAGPAVAATPGVLALLYLLYEFLEPASPDAGSAVSLGLEYRWSLAGRHPVAALATVAALTGIGVVLRPDIADQLAVAVGFAFDRPPIRLAFTAATTAAFWLPNNRLLNLDGACCRRSSPAPARPVSSHPDEMLELHLHWRLWNVFHALWGWDVAQTYRLTSSLAGGVAVLVALGFSRRTTDRAVGPDPTRHGGESPGMDSVARDNLIPLFARVPA